MRCQILIRTPPAGPSSPAGHSDEFGDFEDAPAQASPPVSSNGHPSPGTPPPGGRPAAAPLATSAAAPPRLAAQPFKVPGPMLLQEATAAPAPAAVAGGPTDWEHQEPGQTGDWSSRGASPPPPPVVESRAESIQKQPPLAAPEPLRTQSTGVGGGFAPQGSYGEAGFPSAEEREGKEEIPWYMDPASFATTQSLPEEQAQAAAEQPAAATLDALPDLPPSSLLQNPISGLGEVLPGGTNAESHLPGPSEGVAKGRGGALGEGQPAAQGEGGLGGLRGLQELLHPAAAEGFGVGNGLGSQGWGGSQQRGAMPEEHLTAHGMPLPVSSFHPPACYSQIARFLNEVA